MKQKYRFKLNLQQFAGEEEGSGVEETPAAVEQSIEVSEPEKGVNEPAAAEQKEPNNYEKAFAKRLAEREAKWKTEKEAEIQKLKDQYKDYDDTKLLADYFRELNGNADIMTLKEQIELERLQQRAEQVNVPPEVLKRIDELEAKATKAEEYEKQQAQQTEYQQFRQSIETFAKEKGANADELHQYMYDNEIAKPEVAYNAMRAEQLEKELASAKENAVKEYLASKTVPKVEGNGTPGFVHEDPSKMGWGDIRARAMARIQAASQSQ